MTATVERGWIVQRLRAMSGPTRCRSLQLRSVDRTDSGHSGLAAGTGLHAPKLPAALPVAAPQDRNFSPPTILSMILRSACNPSPTRSSPAVAVAATLARLSASLVVLNRGSV